MDTALTALAVDIKRHHAAAHSAAGEALEHARQAGELLREAKGQIAHGAWLPWLTEHCGVSARQAQKYMRVASHWVEIEGKCAPETHFTLTQALDVLSEDDGSQLVRRLEALAEDLADDDADYELLTARMAALKDDGSRFIDATDDPRALARIIDAARAVEVAAAARRVTALRAIGQLISIPVIPDGGMALADFRDGARAAIVAAAPSREHSGFMHYCILTHNDDDSATHTAARRPVRADALRAALTYEHVPEILAWAIVPRNDFILMGE